MNKEQTIALLKEGNVEVKFTKADGAERIMTCTLQESVLPATSTDKKQPEGNQVVYDVKAEGYRTFKWNKVQTVNGKQFLTERLSLRKVMVDNLPGVEVSVKGHVSIITLSQVLEAAVDNPSMEVYELYNKILGTDFTKQEVDQAMKEAESDS